MQACRAPSAPEVDCTRLNSSFTLFCDPVAMATRAVPIGDLRLRPKLGLMLPLALVVLAVVAVAINPVGFIGSGNDDEQYLAAARCWVAAAGPCLPHSHWWTRWPVVAPLAAFSALLGESRTTLGIGPLLYWAASLALVAYIGRRWFNRTAGLLAAALLVLTPVFTASALQPTADNPELALQLAAIAAATCAFGRQSRNWALAAGILAGAALQARDTSVLFVAASAAAWLFLDRERRKVLLWAIPGLVSAMAVEMVVYWLGSGDPFYRFRLALGHVAVPSAELAPTVDTGRSPLFNPAYIAGWRREAGVRVFWPIDPWLNLLASARINAALIGTMAAAALFVRRLDPAWRRPLVLLILLALLIAILLVYGLAIDPKARMFSCLYAACALTGGALLATGLRGAGRVPAVALFGLMATLELSALYRYPATYFAEQQARQWLVANPGQIEIDEQARAYLALVPEGRSLPTKGSGRPLRIATSLTRCADIPRSAAARGATLVAWAGSRAEGQGQICLFRYAGPPAPRDRSS